MDEKKFFFIDSHSLIRWDAFHIRMLLTHWDRFKIVAILQITFFKIISLNKTLCNSLKIALNVILKGGKNNIPVLVQIMAWCWPGDTIIWTNDGLFTNACMRHLASMSYITPFHNDNNIPTYKEHMKILVYSLKFAFMMGYFLKIRLAVEACMLSAHLILDRTLWCCVLIFHYGIYHRGFHGFAIDCPWCVWCRRLTTRPLYVGPLLEI